MMKRRDVDNLLMVSTLKFEHTKKALAKINAQEAEVSKALEQLHLQEQSAANDLLSLQDINIGPAAMLWQKWAGNMRRELNGKLALLRAQKEEQLRHTREAYGRQQAAMGIKKETEKRQRARRAKPCI